MVGVVVSNCNAVIRGISLIKGDTAINISSSTFELFEIVSTLGDINISDSDGRATESSIGDAQKTLTISSSDVCYKGSTSDVNVITVSNTIWSLNQSTVSGKSGSINSSRIFSRRDSTISDPAMTVSSSLIDIYYSYLTVQNISSSIIKAVLASITTQELTSCTGEIYLSSVSAITTTDSIFELEATQFTSTTFSETKTLATTTELTGITSDFGSSCLAVDSLIESDTSNVIGVDSDVSGGATGAVLSGGSLSVSSGKTVDNLIAVAADIGSSDDIISRGVLVAPEVETATIGNVIHVPRETIGKYDSPVLNADTLISVGRGDTCVEAADAGVYFWRYANNEHLADSPRLYQSGGSMAGTPNRDDVSVSVVDHGSGNELACLIGKDGGANLIIGVVDTPQVEECVLGRPKIELNGTTSVIHFDVDIWTTNQILNLPDIPVVTSGNP